MSLPAYLVAFWLLYALVVAPSAFFNKVAAVMLAVRLLAQIAYNLGAPEAPVLFVLYAGGFALSLFVARTGPCFVAAVLFLPLCFSTLQAMAGVFSPVEEYWTRFGLATAQALIVPFGNDWTRIRALVEAGKREWRDGLTLRRSADAVCA